MIVGLVVALTLSALRPDTAAVRDTTRTVPPWWEATATASGEQFASRLSAWQWHSASVRHRGVTSSFAVEGFTARRYDTWNSGVALEQTSVLARGSYVALREQLAPGASVIPRADLSASLFQSVGRGWEVVPSLRLMAFRSDRVPLVGLGVGRFEGPWYVNARVTESSESGEHGTTVSGMVRRYAAESSPNLFELSGSYGHEVAVLSPSLVALRQTSSIAGRAQHMLSATVGGSLALTFDRNESLPDRRGAALSAFVRW